MGRFRCEERLYIEGPLEHYRARVQGLGGFDRVFALACLAPGALAKRPLAAEALLRAARAGTALKDARFATMVESGLAPGSAFVASEFVHGVSLTELAEYVGSYTSPRAPQPAVWGAIIAAIGAEIAAALAVAHGAGTPVVHGALGPTNVMVTPQGSIKLLDVGLLASVMTATELALLPGRAELVAPELPQAGPLPRPAAPSADIFALGAMLDRLAGIEPAAPPGLGAPTSARAFPPGLRPLLRTFMAPAPEARPAAADVEASLRQLVREARGFEVSVELGTLVRLIMQLRPVQTGGVMVPVEAPPPPISLASLVGIEPPLGKNEPQPFADEPTAILDVAADGKPSALAAVLLELRGADEEEAAPVNPVMNAAMTAAADAAVAAPLALPDSSATKLANLAPAMLGIGFTPVEGVPVPPPPSPEEAVMDADNVGDVASELVSAMASEMAEAMAEDHRAAGGMPSLEDDPEEGEATLVSTEAPPLEELLAAPSAAAPLTPFPFDPSGERHPRIEGTPTGELADLTSGEISASLPDPRKYCPAGPALPAPAAPEPIAFAEFSAAMPAKLDGKRETVTPPSWRPGNVEGSARMVPGPDKPREKAGAAAKKNRQVVVVVVAAAALASAVAGVLWALG